MERSRAGRSASARTRRRRRAFHAAVPRHAPPRRQRPDGDPRLRPRGLRRRARLRRGACRRCIDTGAGASASSSGTRPPTPACSARQHRKASARVWSGSAIGVMTSAARNSKQFLLRPAQAAGLPLDVHGVRYPEEALAHAGARMARATAAGCRMPGRPRSSPAISRPCMCRAASTWSAAWHPHHPGLRGAGLRHPAGLRAVAGYGRSVPPWRGLSWSRRTRRR